jgi:CRAL/TRIO domain
MTEMYKISSQDRLLQNLVCEYEKNNDQRLPACSKAVGHPVETSCTILDLGGIGVRQFWDVKNFVGEASKIGQDRYPETMGKFYVINAPWGFAAIWNVVKGWLDPVTQAKIKILGSSYQKDLLGSIDADSLPSDLGGSCRCKEGCSFSDAGPWNEREKEEVTVKDSEEVIKAGTAA